MTTKTKQLLARIQSAEDYIPQPGDVFRSAAFPRDLFVVVGKGIPTSHYGGERVALQRRVRGEWTGEYREAGSFQVISREFTLVDVGYDKFIWGGFSPNDTGRQYTIHKQAAGVILRAGCRSFTTYAQAAKHWSRKGAYSDMPNEKREIAKRLFAEARRRGWLKVARARPVKKPRKAARR